jgi:triosephosphate isomerase (TIM)
MSPRKPLISGNWKMNENHLEAINLVQKLTFSIEDRDYRATDVAVHPPFTALRSIQTMLDADETPIALGAQDTFWEDAGPFTGEVSAPMLAKLNVRYVIVGHSERRQLFGETDEMVAKKLRAVQRAGMCPIVCVGETLDEREAGEASAQVLGQLDAALGTGRAALPTDAVGALVIAYEPVWAIGTGRNATAADAQEMCSGIRARVAERFGGDAGDRVRIQYGGSVTPDNARELLTQRDIDGALVGGASLDPEAFTEIVQSERS